jgi:mRNA-degrading endonuclease RelE of RelBE toxin-antitoxin system
MTDRTTLYITKIKTGFEYIRKKVSTQMLLFHLLMPCTLMDKIQKFLQRLSSKEKDTLEIMIQDIKHNTTQHMDIKKLVGKDNLYRVRKWNIRIIYRSTLDGNMIINIDYRWNVY